MLILSPREVTFGPARWKNVGAISIDRIAQRESVEWHDAGPHIVFADIPQQRVNVQIKRQIETEIEDYPRPGDTATLSFLVAPGGDAGARRFSAACVVVKVENELKIPNGATRTIDLIAISPDGIADPITFESNGVAP
ncbi:hypothetical protein PHYC_00309 [Phycisphaerales bacterium]|nr:hypothetical protein PHYC_00309 [Phycisphaerales bacterium]